MSIVINEDEYGAFRDAVEMLQMLRKGEHIEDGDWRDVDDFQSAFSAVAVRAKAQNQPESDVARLDRENSALRKLAALKMPCHYCGVDCISKCPSGFPGCALADDEFLGEEAWTYVINQQRAVIEDMQKILRRIILHEYASNEPADPVATVERARALYCKGPITPPPLRGLFPPMVRMLNEWGSPDDKPLPEDEAIERVHPVNEGVPKLYTEAMRFVEARYSKYGLINVMNWLLHRIHFAEIGLRDLEQIASAMTSFEADGLQTTTENYMRWLRSLRERISGTLEGVIKTKNPLPEAS